MIYDNYKISKNIFFHLLKYGTFQNEKIGTYALKEFSLKGQL